MWVLHPMISTSAHTGRCSSHQHLISVHMGSLATAHLPVLEGLKVPISARDDMNGLTLSCTVTPSAACVRFVDARKPRRQLPKSPSNRPFETFRICSYARGNNNLSIREPARPGIVSLPTQMVLPTPTVHHFTQTPNAMRHTDTNHHSYSNVPHNSCALAFWCADVM